MFEDNTADIAMAEAMLIDMDNRDITEEETDEILNSPSSGDPVLVTTGRYVFEVEDIEITDSSFLIKENI